MLFHHDQDEDIRAMVLDLAEAVSKAYSDTSMKQAPFSESCMLRTALYSGRFVAPFIVILLPCLLNPGRPLCTREVTEAVRVCCYRRGRG